MKAAELRELTIEELKENLLENQETIQKMKINHKVAESENPIQIRAVRRGIARIKAELRSREFQANK